MRDDSRIGKARRVVDRFRLDKMIHRIPAEYPYDPRWWVISLQIGLAATFTVVAAARFVPGSVGLAGVGVCSAAAIVLLVRRVVFPRVLRIDEQGVSVPSGFMRSRIRRVLFADVMAVRQAALPFTGVLSLRNHERTLEVVSSMLPAGGYLEICQLIHERFHRETRAPSI